jgi:hypothetical protein
MRASNRQGGTGVKAVNSGRAYAVDMVAPIAFEALDFLYTPSRDVPADMADFVDGLAARVVFAIEDGGIQAALLELTDGPPRVLLTSHVEGDRPIMVYRVPDHDAAVRDLKARGWTPVRSLEIPQGPCSSFRTPGGHRVAIYENVRPFVLEHFSGRRDF